MAATGQGQPDVLFRAQRVRQRLHEGSPDGGDTGGAATGLLTCEIRRYLSDFGTHLENNSKQSLRL